MIEQRSGQVKTQQPEAWCEAAGMIQGEPPVRTLTFPLSGVPLWHLLRGAIKVLIIALAVTDRQQHRHLPE